ncbi:MAG TPA: 50S ribosomal protein L29 [Candidatus Atribacteria bacterium]|nr:50S ribosomal protein L29 [Candidatus Atribacteria bacterium]HEC92357.1 50S ribosomal protein L29 [Candidatus Atribacteria bacterium]
MKSNELRDLSIEELQKKLVDFKDELFSLRFQMVTGQLGNPMRIREVKRNIARVKTILREIELQKNKI